MGADLFFVINLGVYFTLMIREFRWFLMEKKRLLYLRELEHFLGEVRHHYYIHGMVDEAIYDVLPSLEGALLAYITDIYDILNAKDLEEEVYKFNEREHNRFVKTFLALCISVLQFGDKLVNEQSLFLTNIKNLRQEIGIEVLKREKINYLFSGLMFMILLPGCFLQVIENWGVSNLRELETYYNGTYGMIAMGVIFLFSLITYVLVRELREMKEAKALTHPILSGMEQIPVISELLEAWESRNYGTYLIRQDLLRNVGESITPKQFLLKQYFYMIGISVSLSLFLFSVHENNKNHIINSTYYVNTMISSLNNNQIEQVKNDVVRYSRYFKSETVKKEEMFHIIKNETGITNEKVIIVIADEVERRVTAYQKEQFHWWEFLIVLAVGILSFQAPGIYLYYKKRVRRMGMEDEVIQFHSIILMLMYMDRITVDTILEWMEQFADIFRLSLQECINEFSAGEESALLLLKEKEPFLMFQRLVENLIISDQIGIAKAFDEIAVDRVNYQERRKQENEIYITNKSLWGKLIAYIPLVLVLGLYLILPFIFESLSQLVGFMNEIQNF